MICTKKHKIKKSDFFMNSKFKIALGILLVAIIFLCIVLSLDNHSNNACEINNAVDFEVPSNFKEVYKLKDGSFIRYKNGCDHLITISKIESDEDYRLSFGVDDAMMKISKTDTPNIYKRCITEGVCSEIDFIEMVKVNNKTYAVFILDTAQVDVMYDPTSLQDELNEFNKLNGVKPVKFL